MFKVSIITIAILNLALSGCKTLERAPTADWPYSGTLCAKENACNSKEAIDAFNKASKFCRDVQNFYENRGNRTNIAKLAIGGIGTLAGAVVAPATSGTTAAAWSGLSGATNAFQVSIDETFSASLTVKRRKAVQTAAKEGAGKVLGGSTPTEKVELSVQMAMNCAISPAAAEQEALKALLEG